MNAGIELRMIHALIAERGSVEVATKYAARLPPENVWRRIIETWAADSAQYLVAVRLPNQMLFGMPNALPDVRGLIELGREEKRDAPFHLKVMCSQALASALLDAAGIAAVDWTTPPTLH